MDIRPQDLPNWMRQSRRGVDWGVLLVILLSGAVAWAFLLQPGLPRTNASENYVFRTADYSAALREGRLYPRWSPNVFSGYGSPIPHYFPPGAPYFAALLDIFFTSDPVTAVRAAYVVSLILSGTMVYVFVTRRVGAAAGLFSALLYVYSPYVGLTIPHVLGDLPVSISLALLPALLWSVSRLLSLNRAVDFPLLAVITAGLFLTDLRYGCAGLVLAIFLIILEGFSSTPKQRLIFATLGLITGIFLASIYWLPALLEWEAVHWLSNPLIRPALTLNFIDLITPLRQIDLGELVMTPQLTLGLSIMLFTGISLFVILIYRKQMIFHAIFLVIGIGLLVINLLFFPSQVWLLGVVTLCLSIGGSAVLSKQVFENRRRLALPVMMLAVLTTSLPVWLSPSWLPAFGDTSPEAQIDYERQGYGISVLPPDTSAPATIADTLGPNRYLIESYQSGIVNKITPDQFTVSVLQHNTHSDRIQLSVNTPDVLNVLTAFFPGWRASVNGIDTTLEPDPETGLIRVFLSDTRISELFIVLDSTPPRTGAWIISWCALIVVLFIGWRRTRRQGELYDDLELLATAEARLAGIVAAGFILIILLFAMPTSPLSMRQRPGSSLEGSIGLRSGSAVGMEALAYRLEDTDYQPGDIIHLDMYWRSVRFLAENYQVRAYLMQTGNESIRWFETELHHPGSYPTRRWISNRYVRDSYTFQLSSGAPTGDYRIAFEVYDCEPFCVLQSRLSFFDANGGLIGQVLTLPSIISVRP